jgi:hypothetical protein
MTPAITTRARRTLHIESVTLATIASTHRAAHAELREGMAALERAAAKGKLQKDGTRLPRKATTANPAGVESVAA